MTAVSPDRERTGLAATFRNSGLRRLYCAEVISGAGDGVFWVALVVFLSDQPAFGLWLTLAVVARLAPRALLSLPAGSLVDRSDMRRLIVGIDLLRALLMAAIAVMASMGVGALPVLVLVLGSYTIAAPTRPALSAVVPAIAGERHLAVANAALSTIRQVMTFVGPLLGVLVATWSAAAGFAVNAVTFSVSGAILAAIRQIPRNDHSTRPVVDRSSGRGLIDSFLDGLGVVRAIHELPPLVTLIGIMYLVRGAEMVLHVYVVRDLLGAPVDDIGLLGGAIGLGAVLAMPIAARAANSTSPVRPIVASLALTAIPTAALALITRTVWACVVLVFVGAGMVVFEVVIVVMVQRVTPASSLGRVFGAINGASNTGKLVGAVVAPVLIAALGLEVALAAVAGLLLVAGALAIRPLVMVGRLAAARQRELRPRVRTLAGLGIFEGASEASLERLAAELEPVTAPAGTIVIREGDRADDLYVTVAGRLSVSVHGREVGALGPDDWFGEIGLVGRRPRTATVEAVDDTMLWRLPGETFLAVLDNAGAAPSALLDGIADRLATHR
jgi:MFS family permease